MRRSKGSYRASAKHKKGSLAEGGLPRSNNINKKAPLCKGSSREAGEGLYYYHFG